MFLLTAGSTAMASRSSDDSSRASSAILVTEMLHAQKIAGATTFYHVDNY